MQRSALDRWLYEPEAVLAALRAGRHDGLAPDFDPDALSFAMLRPESIAAAIFDRNGEVIAANDVFDLSGARPVITPEARRAIADGGRRAIEFITGPDGVRRAIVCGPLAEARHWALPSGLLNAGDLNDGAIVTLSVALATTGEAMQEACASFGLTELQTRVIVGVIRSGDVKAAARLAGVTYETARGVVAEATRRAGAPRLTALVARIVRLAFGIWPEGREGDVMLRDVWGLTDRQAQLALRIAQGLPRAQAAQAAGMSEAVAKKELNVIFAVLEVRTAPELTRVIMEARALALLTRATGQQLPADAGDFMEPLRLLRREDGTQIAFSDYGPASGRPLLIVHSSSASRQAPTRLVRALQAKGFRPFAIDRPGFGLTDDLADLAAWRADPFAAACEDIRLVCRHLKLSRIDVIGRGGAQVVLALAQQSPGLLGRVVLVNPDPPSTASGSGRGAVGAVKEAFYRFPNLVERVTAMVASQLTPARARGIVLQSVRSSPPDLAAMDDPRNYADYARGFRLFTTGRVRGYITEQRAMRDWSLSSPVAAAARWRVLMGDVDPLHEPARTHAFWRDTLPDTPIEMIEGAGRFLVMTHADRVADTLAGISPS